ncbi:MAG: hypothetical protein NW206_05615 [Hyphomonadaceae bacterium]|nr:hypothetical protein [Hyphomonadaceae bacterium]
MAQLVTAILSQQGDLTATALEFTGDDTNEASLLVGRVITRAFRKFDHDATIDAIGLALRRDLQRMIAERRLS